MCSSVYTIGIDFGTLSARAVLADAGTGAVIAERECPYPHRVVDRVLPDGVTRLPPRWALQVPGDYLHSLAVCVRGVMEDSGAAPEQVAGLACDVTASTMLPADETGIPLCETAAFAARPNAYAKLWKHHAAQDQARRMEALLRAERPELLRPYGGRVSSEWFLPKMLQTLEEDPETAAAADVMIEATDWIVWRLTGNLTRSTCAAGFKRLWSPELGDLPGELLDRLCPGFAAWCDRAFRGEVLPVWAPAGRLTPEWAARLGLSQNTVVAVGNVDAHAAVAGSGITAPGTALSILGTSACQLLLDEREVFAPGVAGCVKDAILPDCYAYETGQSCVGDLLAWFVERQVPPDYAAAAKGNVHGYLTELASALRPGQSGLVALDWWNGQRSPYMDDDLSGLLLGLTVHTKPEEIYRALLEAIAFGSRLIFDTFEEAGLRAEEVVVTGGIANKNPLLMQIYADVLERPVRVAEAAQGSALGAAVFAAVAAGVYPDLPAAARAMTAPGERVYRPDPEHFAAYRELYAIYRKLSEEFARGNDAMKRLLALKTACK